MRCRAAAFAALALVPAIARAQSAPVDSAAAAPAYAQPRAILPEVRGWQTGLFAPDRLQHGSFSFTIAIGVGLGARSPGAGAAGALTLGVAKELSDVRRGRTFDLGDLAADAFGAALGAILARAVQH